MKEYLTFRKMITPLIIQILFWLSVVICIVFGIIAMATARYTEQTLMGLGMLLVGPIICRIYCELLIVIFSINSNLADIKTGLANKSE